MDKSFEEVARNLVALQEDMKRFRDNEPFRDAARYLALTVTALEDAENWLVRARNEIRNNK